MKTTLFAIVVAVLSLLLNSEKATAQEVSTALDRITSLPVKYYQRLQSKTAALNKTLSRQTEKYLQQLQKREAKIYKTLSRLDSAGAERLFAHSAQQYRQYLQQAGDSANGPDHLNGAYLPYLDSLKSSLSFLNKHPELLKGSSAAEVKQALANVKQYEGKLQQSEEIKAFIRQRRQQIRDYLKKNGELPAGVTREFRDLDKDAYYYSQQVQQYKEMWKHPDQLEQKALSLLNQLPVFQQFMKEHSELAGLFRLPGNYGTSAALGGLQTRSQVQQLIENQVASGGPNAGQLLRQNLQAAQAQLNKLKDQLSARLGGSGDRSMPDFKPNSQKTKTFFQRLEYGTNLQTAHADYFFPTTTDLGLSVGYKLNDKSEIGIGASYKIGWGKDYQHIAVSSQGVGFRSYLDYKLKGSFYASGGFEYNYQQPFSSIQQIRDFSGWEQSGLIGLSKVVSLKSKFFKKTKLQLLWDFLSYGQTPRTQPVKFRVGYDF